MNTSSLVIQTLLNNTIFLNDSTQIRKDQDNGAFIYIIVVVLFYSSGALLLLISRVRPRSDIVSLNDLHAAENLINQMKDQIETKKILEQLSDKKYRARAWSIYRKDSSGQNMRGSFFYIKNEENILKNLEKKIETIKQREDASFELRYIGLHKNRNAAQYDKDQMNNLMKEWGKIIVKKSKNETKSDYYYTIAGSSFQTSQQERKLIMDTFKHRKASAETIQPSKTLPNLVSIEQTPKTNKKNRFSINVVVDQDNSTINKVTFNPNITNFY